MSTVFDVAVIGAGIAGLSAGYALSPYASVIVFETETHPGQHATGRSAAIYIAGYGSQTIRELSRLSRPFFEAPPKCFGEGSLLSPRGIMTIAAPDELLALKAYAEDLKTVSQQARFLDPDEATRLNPLLKAGSVAGAVFDETAADIDVDRLCQGFIKGIKQNEGEVRTACPINRMRFDNGLWYLMTPVGEVVARKVLNAAGAWADQVALMAGTEPKGLKALRRSAAIVPAPNRIDVNICPMTLDIHERFYFKPEGGKVLISPAEEEVSEPCDAYADDMDLAYGIDRAQGFLSFDVGRVDHSWAGLRTFAPDREPVIGRDTHLPNFYWSAGQGGYGVQTAPAWGTKVAEAMLGFDFSKSTEAPQNVRVLS
jgi:D-arginine dehydrogenase